MPLKIKKYKKRELGAAFIEILIVVPFLAVLTFLCVAFINFVNTYALSSQSIREASQLAALFMDSQVGTTYETCIYNNRDGACNSGFETSQWFEGRDDLNCEYKKGHHDACAHQMVLSRVRRYLSIINVSDDLKEVNLTTSVTQKGNEVIFNVKFDMDHESFFSVFGSRLLDVSSFAFIRSDDIPAPDPSGEESPGPPENPDGPPEHPEGPEDPDLPKPPPL